MVAMVNQTQLPRPLSARGAEFCFVGFAPSVVTISMSNGGMRRQHTQLKGVRSCFTTNVDIEVIKEG